MSYKDKYRSIQLNLLKDREKDLIEWLEEMSAQEERSLNFIIKQLIKKAIKEQKTK